MILPDDRMMPSLDMRQLAIQCPGCQDLSLLLGPVMFILSVMVPRQDVSLTLLTPKACVAALAPP